MRTCTIDGCQRRHDARGLCKNHYNKQAAYKHRITCVTCGAEHMSRRSTGMYCSDKCKSIDYARPSCPVPASHPSRRPDPEPTLCRVWMKDCAWCGEAFAGRQPHSSLCSRRCARKRGKAARKARERGAVGTYTWTQVIGLWLLFDRQCAYCDDPIEGQPDPDHVVPLSRGGHNSIGNILPACRMCNADKRDLLLAEWNADRARRGLPPRHTTWLPTDRRFAHMHADVLTRAA